MLFYLLNGTHYVFITLECNLRSNGIKLMKMRRDSYRVSFRITGTFRKHFGHQSHGTNERSPYVLVRSQFLI